MSPAALLVLVAIGAALAYTLWIYRRRELPVPGRGRLATLRVFALTLVLLLLLNPELRGTASAARDWWVLDTSPSMTALLTSGETPEARAGREIVGSEVIANTDADEANSGGSSRVLNAVSRAVESGARSVTLVSDGRVEDGVELRALLARAPVDFRWVDVGGGVRNAGVASLTFAEGAKGGEPVEGTVELVHEGAEGSSGQLTLVVGTDTVLSQSLAIMGDRGRIAIPVTFSAPEGMRHLPLRVSVAIPDDGFTADDSRSTVVEVDPDRGSATLISWSPGWEPRYLIATLSQVAGVPVRGFLKAGPDRYLRMGEAPSMVDGAEVRRTLEDAAFVISHGQPDESDSLLVRAVNGATRRVRFGSVDAANVRRPGEWYVAGDLPPSPLTGELAGIPLLGLPPLGEILPDASVGSGLAPLLLQRDGTGESVPALVLSTDGSRRTVNVLATGFWRWSLRPGAPATLYRRLWSGVAGWLLAGEGASQSLGIAPRMAVGAPGKAVLWDAAPAADGNLMVEWADQAGNPARVDTVGVDALGRGESPALDAGTWSWTATVLDGPAEGRIREGLVIREAWSADLSLPRDEGLADLQAQPVTASIPGRPLRTHPLPWLLLLMLLSAEWIVRRRSGLR